MRECKELQCSIEGDDYHFWLLVSVMVSVMGSVVVSCGVCYGVSWCLAVYYGVREGV